jgi:hypothetical protein
MLFWVGGFNRAIQGLQGALQRIFVLLPLG